MGVFAVVLVRHKRNQNGVSDDMFPQMRFKMPQQFPTAPLAVSNAYLFAQIHKHDDFRRKITSDNNILQIKPPCLTPNKPPMECLVANENWLREPQSITVTTSFRVHVFLRWGWVKTMSENILIYCFFLLVTLLWLVICLGAVAYTLCLLSFQVGKRTCSSTMVVQKKSVSGQHRRTCKN